MSKRNKPWARYVASLREAELNRQYVEGYKRVPESTDDSGWRIWLAAEVWGAEDWDELELP